MVDDEEGTSPEEPLAENLDAGRRKFMKVTAGAAAAVGAIGVGAYAGVKMKGTPHDEFPVPVKEDLKPFDQRNMLWTFVMSDALQKKHPERIAKFENGFDFHGKLTTTYLKSPPQEVPGYTQLDRALGVAAWQANHQLSPGQQFGQPGSGILSWDYAHRRHRHHGF